MTKSPFCFAALLFSCSLVLAADPQAPAPSASPVEKVAAGINAKGETLAARVGKQEITQAQVIADMVKVFGNQVLEEKNKLPKQFEQIFALFRDQNVGLTLFGQAAETNAATLGKNPETKEALEKARLQILIGAFVSDYIKKKVTDEAVAALYEKLSKEKPVSKYFLRHILVADEATAKAIIKTLKSGKPFAELAKEKSLDKESAKDGGALPPFIESQLPPAILQAVGGLKVGGFTEAPVSVMGKWEVFLLEKREKATLAEATPALKDTLSRQALQDLVTTLKDKTDVQLYDGNGQPTKEVSPVFSMPGMSGAPVATPPVK